jgi:hypothetical protein
MLASDSISAVNLCASCGSGAVTGAEAGVGAAVGGTITAGSGRVRKYAAAPPARISGAATSAARGRPPPRGVLTPSRANHSDCAGSRMRMR